MTRRHGMQRGTAAPIGEHDRTPLKITRRGWLLIATVALVLFSLASAFPVTTW